VVARRPHNPCRWVPGELVRRQGRRATAAPAIRRPPPAGPPSAPVKQVGTLQHTYGWRWRTLECLECMIAVLFLL
jgi:hypothetical protein